MGTITTSFWECRFIITPEEFNQFISYCIDKQFSFDGDSHCHYANTYHSLIMKSKAVIPEEPRFIEASIIKKGCGGLHLAVISYGKLNFLRLASPKGRAVDDEDGLHFHYENILKFEPNAQEAFADLSGVVKRITKPLYNSGKPIYSVRISKDGWNDLSKSLISKDVNFDFSTKW